MRLRRLANPWLILAAIFVAHVLANAVWITKDHSMRSQDMGPHLEFQANAYAVVMDEGLRGVARLARGDQPQVWPSAGYLPWVSLALLFGQGATHMQMYNLFYLALLMTALFLTVRKIHSPRAGVLAAALVSFYPLVYGDGRQFGIDMPGAACAALAVYLMLCTRRLSRPWRTLGLGAACGAGLLICPRIALFLIPAAVCLLVVSLLAPRGTTRIRVLLHAALGLTTAGAISACWWWGRLAAMSATLTQHQQGLGPGNHVPSWIYYLKVLPWAFSFYLVLMGALALIVLVRRRGASGLLDPDRLLLVLVWFGAGLAALLIIKVHHLRHLLPLVPAVALLTAVGLCTISRRGIRRLVIGLALGVAVSSWLLDSFATQVDFGWPGVELTQTPTLIADLEVTTGPPVRRAFVLAVEEAARVLHDRHDGSGHGVVLHFDLDGYNDRWVSRPLLTCALPGLRILKSTYDNILREANEPFVQLWRYSIARSVTPARHCYYLTFNDCRPKGCTGPPPAQQPGAPLKQVFDRTIEQVRITLWRRVRCPPALTTSSSPQAGPAASGPTIASYRYGMMLRDNNHGTSALGHEVRVPATARATTRK